MSSTMNGIGSLFSRLGFFGQIRRPCAPVHLAELISFTSNGLIELGFLFRQRLDFFGNPVDPRFNPIGVNTQGLLYKLFNCRTGTKFP
jgi:hypothetical protein